MVFPEKSPKLSGWDRLFTYTIDLYGCVFFSEDTYTKQDTIDNQDVTLKIMVKEGTLKLMQVFNNKLWIINFRIQLKYNSVRRHLNLRGSFLASCNEYT